MLIIQPTILDLMEYANDGAAQAAYAGGAFVTVFPPAHNAAYVKATNEFNSDYRAYFATDPAKSVTGVREGNCWLGNGTNERVHVDLGSAVIVKRIYYEPMHSEGANSLDGIKDVIVQGSNTGSGTFDDLVYANDEGWTTLACDVNAWHQHVAADQADPHYIQVTNTTAYRYYAIKAANNWAAGSSLGFRRIQFQVAALQSYSEATIKQEGSYSLKGIAAITDSLNKTLTRTVSPTIDLSNKTIIKFDMYAGRTGANIKIGIHDSGGTTTEITPTIAAANIWQTVVWDISAVTNANKDAIDSIIVTIVNADAANTFYLDNMFGDVINSYLIHRGRDRFRMAGISLGN